MYVLFQLDLKQPFTHTSLPKLVRIIKKCTIMLRIYDGCLGTYVTDYLYTIFQSFRSPSIQYRTGSWNHGLGGKPTGLLGQYSKKRENFSPKYPGCWRSWKIGVVRRQTILLSRAISVGRNLNSHSYIPWIPSNMALDHILFIFCGTSVFWRMGVSGPGAISRVPCVKLTYNLFPQIFTGAKWG